MTPNDLFKNAREALACGAVVLNLAAAAFCTYTAFSPARPAPPRSETRAAQPPAFAGFLADRLQNRLSLIEETEESESAALGPGGARFAVRPALRLRAVVVSGKRRCAAVAVEGEKSVKIVDEGGSAAGIVFKEISPAGALCAWRGSDFFVPVE